MLQILILILSTATASLVLSKRYKIIPLYMFFVFLFTLDFANYYLKIDSSISGYLVKMYTEILFVFVATHFAARSLNSNKMNKTALYVLLFTALTLVIGIAKNGAFSAILDWRVSILPIALPLLLVYSKIVNIETSKKIMHFVYILTILNTMLALYQYATFNGDAQSTWRYDFLVDARQNNETETEDRFVNYQIVRDGNLRASGVFVSALQYSYTAALSAVYALVMLLSTWKRKPLIAIGYTSALALLILGMLASQVRASLVIFFISSAAYFICTKRANSTTSYSSKKAFLLILGSYLGLLLTIFVFGANSLDASAAGRAPQYIKAISEFSIIGAGLGRYKGQFDSDIVFGALTFGALYLVIPILFVQQIKKFSLRKDASSDGCAQIVTFGFCIATAAASVSLFQHLSGTVFYYMVWILLAASTAHQPKSTKMQPLRMRAEFNQHQTVSIRQP